MAKYNWNKHRRFRSEFLSKEYIDSIVTQYNHIFSMGYSSGDTVGTNETQHSLTAEDLENLYNQIRDVNRVNNSLLVNPQVFSDLYASSSSES